MSPGELGILGWFGGGLAAAVAGAPPGLSLGLAAAGGGWIALASARPGLGLFGRVRTHVPSGIAMSFDDGPDPVSTPLVLDILAEAGVCASFFFLADRAARWPDLVARTAAAGHTIGLHGLRHSSALTTMGVSAGTTWLREGVARLEGAGAPPIRWFRPPFGVVSPRLFRSVEAAGLAVVWCSVRAGDGVSIPSTTLRRRLWAARSGDIVLMHDTNPVTRGLLPEFLAARRDTGFSLLGDPG